MTTANKSIPERDPKAELANFRQRNQGTLPHYFEGRPLEYLCADGGKLCPDCANGRNGSLASEDLDPECPDDKQWLLYGVDLVTDVDNCSHCGTRIPPQGILMSMISSEEPEIWKRFLKAARTPKE